MARLSESKLAYNKLFGGDKKDKEYIEIDIIDLNNITIQRYIMLDEEETFNEEHLSALTLMCQKLKFNIEVNVLQEKFFKSTNMVDIMVGGTPLYTQNSIKRNTKEIIEDLIPFSNIYYTAVLKAEKENQEKYANLKQMDPNAVQNVPEMEDGGNSKLVLFQEQEMDDRQYQ